MTTVIKVSNSRGTVGCCDARCYLAKEPQCDCICGGVNHGVGQEQAAANTKEKYKEWLETMRKVDPTCFTDGVQQDLF